MNPWDVVRALENASGRLEKEKILSNLPKDDEFWSFGKLAMDPFVRFFIKKLPEVDEHGNGAQSQVFRTIVKALTTREITGNDARSVVQAFAKKCTKDQWELWYSRILDRDLDCGIGVTTFNKMAPQEHRVRIFKCQLASPMKDVKREKLFRDGFAEAKYDGVRTLWFIKKVRTQTEDDGIFEPDEQVSTSADVRVFSRNGKEFFNFGSIADQLSTLVENEHFPEEGIVIDGEVISAKFQELMKQARRKTDVDFKGFLMAFDVLLMDDFMNERSNVPFEIRRSILSEMVEEIRKSHGQECLIIQSHGIRIDPVEQEAELSDFCAQMMEAGYEGIVLKRLSSPYMFDRTTDWLKVKHEITVDLRVVDIEEGEGRLSGTCGAMVCEDTDAESGKFIRAKVGAISDMLRAEIWSNPESVIGRVAEIQADEITQNQNGTYSLRFPRFKRFRDDKE